MGENTRLLYDIMHYLEVRSLPGMLLLVDFEKAFDTIEWSFIEKVLNIYNFGENFIKWFRILYNNSTSSVLNNGHTMYFQFFQVRKRL